MTQENIINTNESIIAIGTEEGNLFCFQCAELLNMDFAGQSTWLKGQERELAEWNSCCYQCGTILPDPLILQVVEAIEVCSNIGETIDIIADYCTTKAILTQIKDNNSSLVWQQIAQRLYSIVSDLDL